MRANEEISIIAESDFFTIFKFIINLEPKTYS